MSKDSRLNLRLEHSLIEWARDYCKRKGMDVSSLIRQLLMQEKEKDEEQRDKSADAEQI
jgi:antitoxin component of RelBE/YafQ-DinJ toxin-antitoxin module